MADLWPRMVGKYEKGTGKIKLAVLKIDSTPYVNCEN
jgi:hypothetical protein